MTIRKMLLIVWVCMVVGALAGLANAADTTAVTTVEAGGISLDLSSVFTTTRGGEFIAFDGTTYTSLYAPVVSFHDAAGLELVNLNAGAMVDNDSVKGSPLLAFGLRADNLLKKVLLSSEWLKTHATGASLPPLEAGLALSWFSPTHTWIYGINVAVKFGS